MDLRETPIEDFFRHPWEAARFRFFLDILIRYAFPSYPKRILDVGAGDAWFSLNLLESFPSDVTITCWDNSYGSIVPPFSKKRVSFCSERPLGQFQLALLLDVLEHVEDDDNFLESVIDMVDSGGFLLVSVPAWRCLMGFHDYALAHYRRYNPQDAIKLLIDLNLQILISGGLFHTPLVFRSFSVIFDRFRIFEHSLKPELKWRWGRHLAKIADKILFLENSFSMAAASVNLQIPGLSWWALCRKPLL